MGDTCDRADNVFGPTIRGCRDNTDFTLLFEQSLFSLLPTLCFLACSVYRYLELTKRKRVLKTSIDWLILAKIVGHPISRTDLYTGKPKEIPRYELI